MKRIFSLLLCVVICVTCSACGLGWKRQTLTLNEHDVTVSVASDKGYSYSFSDNEIVVDYNGQRVCSGSLYSISNYNKYMTSYSNNYILTEVENIDTSWSVYHSRYDAADFQVVAVLIVDNEVFFMITGDNIDLICDFLQYIKF